MNFLAHALKKRSERSDVPAALLVERSVASRFTYFAENPPQTKYQNPPSDACTIVTVVDTDRMATLPQRYYLVLG